MSNPVRIGYVAKMFPRLSETFVLNEILELERQGAEVTVFSAKKPNEGRFHPQLAALKAPVLYLEDLDAKKWAGWVSRDWDTLRASRDRIWDLLDEALGRGDAAAVDQIWSGAWIASRALELGLDRLHSHFATLPAMLAHLAHRVSGIPYSFTAHAKDIFVYSPEETRLPELVDRADFMVTVTEYNKRYLRGRIPELDADKIQVVHNGIDLSAFTPVPESERADDLILGVGRLVPKKGFDVLLRACELLRARGVTFRCRIAGGGVSEGELHALRDELGLQDSVEFLGPLKVNAVRDLMREATVFALPCRTAADGNLDALPTVLLEALACGLPAVSTAVSGIPEIITDGREGLLVPDEDPVALADALERLLESRELRAACGRHGRAKAETAFDIRRSVGRMHELFRNGAEPAAAAPHRGARLLYVNTDKGIPFGGTKGASIHMREFLDAAVAAGQRPVAAVRRTSDADGRQPPCPVKVLAAPAAEAGGADPVLLECAEIARHGAFAEQLADLNAKERFDLVYERYSLFGTAGLELAQRENLPFVLEVNSPLLEEAAEHRDLRLEAAARAIAARLFAAADRVVAVSEGVRDHVLSLAPEAEVVVVPNGVDTTRVAPGPRLAANRARVGAATDADFVVGFVGRVRPWHGVELLVEALSVARRASRSLHLCVIGDAGGEEERLRRLARELGVERSVTFLGAVPPAEVPALLDALDAVAAPYPPLRNFYFSPLKVYEAMAAGKAVIASAIGQILDVIEDGRTGLLTDPGDVGGLAEAMLRLQGDPQLTAALGAAAREEAVAAHDWSRRLERILDFRDAGARRVEAAS